MLLSAGLGNSKTSVIVCANMDAGQIAETVATMRFGEKCALVETEARNNASMLEQVLRQLDEEITACEGEIRSKERWESRAETRADELAEEGTYEKMSGGVETKKISLLVGAEAERKRLEGLLIKRARFIGAAPIDEEGEIDGVAGGGGGGKGRRVVGFGKQSEIYGLGGGFDETAESAAANSRFEAAEAARVPAAVRARAAARAAGAQRAKAGGKGGGGVHWRDEVVKEGGKEGKDGGQALGMGWASGSFMVDAEDAETLQRKAQRVKRNRLAYSGISS
ncbi:hypothetical protein B484DRAFT_16206 [Ochromonadaceae sp. CCMP2298]|nr:hypothetical protein B484DRAFT_16206 [Ochromonadaceae sp. CCMP2298]